MYMYMYIYMYIYIHFFISLRLSLLLPFPSVLTFFPGFPSSHLHFMFSHTFLHSAVTAL